MAARGQAQSIEKARLMLARCKVMGVRMLVPLAHTIIADLLGQVGLVEEGHAELDAAFADMNVTQERHYEAETHRVRGELHLKERQRKEAAAWAALERKAEQCFLSGCGTAEKQGAFAYEVRSALSLARLWTTESKLHEARKLLERICSRSGEWNSPELEQAKTLITELSNSSRPQSTKAIF
jgi:predicted ATPase